MLKMKNTLIIISALAALIISSGCAHKAPEYSLLSQPTVYAMEKKIDLNIGLFLSEELKTTNPAFAKNIEEFAGILFKQVVISSSLLTKETGQLDAWLTPRIVSYSFARPADGFISTRVVEWKLEDKGKSIVWIDTIRGDSRNVDSPEMQDLNMKLTHDLFRKSFQAIKSSPEIRKYEASLNSQKTGQSDRAQVQEAK